PDLLSLRVYLGEDDRIGARYLLALTGIVARKEDRERLFGFVRAVVERLIELGVIERRLAHVRINRAVPEEPVDRSRKHEETEHGRNAYRPRLDRTPTPCLVDT